MVSARGVGVKAWGEVSSDQFRLSVSKLLPTKVWKTVCKSGPCDLLDSAKLALLTGFHASAEVSTNFPFAQKTGIDNHHLCV